MVRCSLVPYGKGLGKKVISVLVMVVDLKFLISVSRKSLNYLNKSCCITSLVLYARNVSCCVMVVVLYQGPITKGY